MNRIDTAREPSPSPPAKSNRRHRVMVCIALLIGAASIWFVIPNATLPPEVVILPASYSIKSPPTPIPDRWIPTSWGWLWRLRYALLGRPAVIDVTAKITRLPDVLEPGVIDPLNQHATAAETNGARAWILAEAELRSLQLELGNIEDFEVIGTPRITSGHTVQANLQQTTTFATGDAQIPVGIFFQCLTLARDKSADLTVAITHSEASSKLPGTAASVIPAESTRIQTNFIMAAKLHLPPGFGAFLLDMNHADPKGRRVGIFITSKVH